MSDELQNTTLVVSAPSQPPSAAGSLLPFFLALLVLVGMAYGGWTWWRVSEADAVRSQAVRDDLPPLPITDFELTERSGKPFRSADMRGHVWLASYFFASCPGNCLRLNANLQYMNSLPELKDVIWVSITCDPDNDNLDVLRQYAEKWGADPDRWLFCRADLDYTKRVARGMNIAMMRQGHQDYGIVIDKSGNIRGVYDAMSRNECKKMRELLLKLLDEEPPQDVVASGMAERKSS